MLRHFYRKRIWLSGFLILFIALMLSKDCVAARFFELYLSRTLLKQGWKVEQIQVEKNQVLVQGVSGPGVFIAEAKVSCYLSCIPFTFHPEITLSQVSLSFEKSFLEEKGNINPLALIFGHSYFSPKIKIQEGEITCPFSNTIFSFHFEPGQEEYQLGSLYLKEKGEEKPFFTAELSKKESGISSIVEIVDGKIIHLLPWITLQSQKWDKIEGQVNAYIKCLVDQEKGLDSLQANISLEKVNLQNISLDYALQANNLEGTLSFTANDSLPIWKQVDLFVTFEDLLWMTKQESFGFTNTLGEIRLQPTENPYLKIGGTLKTKSSLMPFELEGSGEVLEKGAYWLQSNLSFFLPHSQPRIIASFWQNEEEKGVLDAHWEQVGKEVAEVYQEIGSFFDAPKYLLEKGEIEGKVLAKYAFGKWQNIELSDCSAKNFVFSIPSKSISLQGQSATIQGILDKEEIVAMQAEIRKGKLALADLQIEEIIAKVDIVDGEFMPSYLEGSYQGTKIAMQVLAPSAEALLHVECGVYAADLQKWLPSEYKIESAQKDPIFIVLDLSAKEDKAHFAGTVRFPSTANQPQDMDIQGMICKSLSRRVSDFFSAWDLSSAEGTFSLEQFSAKTLQPYCKDLFTTLQLQGSCDLKGSFDQKKIRADFSALDLSLQKDSYRLMGQVGNKEAVSLVYDREKNSFEGRAFIDNLFIEDKLSGLKCEVFDTVFISKDRYIWTDEWRVVFEGLELLGSLSYDGDAIHIASKAYEGDLKDLQPLLKKHLPFMSGIPLEGTFSLEDKAYIGRAEKGEEGWDFNWTVSAKLSNMAYNLGVAGQVKEGHALVSTGSKGGFALKDVRARYDIASFSSDLCLKDFYWIPDEKADFHFIVKEKAKEALALSGVILSEEDGFTIHISPYSHVLGLALAADPIKIKKNELPPIFKGSFSYKWQQLPSYLAFFKQVGFSLPDYKIPSMEGDAKVQVTYERKTSRMHLHLDSQGVIYEGRPLGNVECDLYHKDGLYKVDPCQVGPYSFSGKMRKKESKWILEELSFRSLVGNVLAEGSYDPALYALAVPSFSFSLEKDGQKIEAKGSFKGSFSKEGSLKGQGNLEKIAVKQEDYSFLAKKGMPFSISSEQGIILEKSQWDCIESKQNQILAKANIQNLTYFFPEQKLIMGGGLFKISKEGIAYLQSSPIGKEVLRIKADKEISMQLDAELALGYKKVSGVVRNGSLDLLGIGVDVKNVQFLQEKERLYLSCQTLFQKQPVCVQWQSRADLTSVATLVFKEDVKAPGLSIQMDKMGGKSWVVQSAEGSFQGLDLKIQKTESIDRKNLSYNTRLKVDFVKLSLLLPEKSKAIIQKWGLGQGYSYLGIMTIDPNSFHLTSLSGKLQAEEFTCLGRTMQSLKAKVQFTKELFSVQELSLEDQIGLLTIKTVEARIHPETGNWFLTAPVVHVKDFSPSAFMNSGERGAVIKNISLYQLRGFLKDINSFEASGALNFVKPIKKEFSFWDIPLNLMKDFGLDTGLLTPVIGEAEFLLSQGRCYFTLLKNMYSEGERSQFILAGSSSEAYLALDGTWHVDLKMKQNVVWRVTEDLVLSIRGTLEKPKYSFKWRDNGS